MGMIDTKFRRLLISVGEAEQSKGLGAWREHNMILLICKVSVLGLYFCLEHFTIKNKNSICPMATNSPSSFLLIYRNDDK